MDFLIRGIDMLMFFKISRSEVNKMDPDERTVFFRKLIMASKRGNHRIVFHKEFSLWAMKRSYFSEDIKTHLNRLYKKNLPSYNDITNKHDHLEIKLGDFKPRLKGKYKWEIGHKELIDGNYLEPCRLLVENKDKDGEFYSAVLITIGLNAMGIEDYGIFRNCFEVQDGNGRNISNVLNKLIGNREIACCICDSDRFAPMDEPGVTFRETQRKIPEGKFLSPIVCTPCHEVENFLSMEVVRISLREKRDKMMSDDYGFGNKKNSEEIRKIDKALKNINKIEDRLNELPDPAIRNELWLYFDIKKGLNKRNKGLQQVNNATKKWLTKSYGVKRLDELDLPGIGEKLMEIFISCDAAKRDFFAHFRQVEEFKEWIDKFSWYFCGQKAHNL